MLTTRKMVSKGVGMLGAKTQGRKKGQDPTTVKKKRNIYLGSTITYSLLNTLLKLMPERQGGGQMVH